MVEAAFTPQFLPQAETIFAVANGYLGMRAFEEGEPAYRHGTFVNGFHETWPIPYGERAFGFATTGQTMANLPDANSSGCTWMMNRSSWAARGFYGSSGHSTCVPGRSIGRSSGKRPPGQLLIESRRLVSFHEKHVAALWYRVTVLNARPRSSWCPSSSITFPSGRAAKTTPGWPAVCRKGCLLPNEPKGPTAGPC